MTLSQRQLHACLEVMQWAMLQTRAWAWDNSASADQLGDLMDAVHDIPARLQHWEEHSEQAVLQALHDYDQKWTRESAQGLVATYRSVADGRTQE